MHCADLCENPVIRFFPITFTQFIHKCQKSKSSSSTVNARINMNIAHWHTRHTHHTRHTSSRLTLSHSTRTSLHACPMPFITTRPNHHVKDIVGCARLPFPFTAFIGASPWIRPLKEEGASVLCPCSQPVGYFSWRRAGFGLPNPPKPPDALAIGSDWAKGNAGPASHAPVAVFGEVRASSVGRETSREGGL